MNYSSNSKKENEDVKIYLGDVIQFPYSYLRHVAWNWILVFFIIGIQAYFWSHLTECNEVNEKYHTEVCTKFKIRNKIMTREGSHDNMIFYLENAKDGRRLTMEDLSTGTYLKYDKGDTVFFNVSESDYDGVHVPQVLSNASIMLYILVIFLSQISFWSQDFTGMYSDYGHYRHVEYLYKKVSKITGRLKRRFERRKVIYKALLYIPYILGTLVSTIGTVAFIAA